MITEKGRVETALRLIADREMRYRLFPSDIFDEYAWNMLLHLYVARARGEALPEDTLIDLVRASTRDGQRWLYQLSKDGQIEQRVARQEVSLTAEAVERLKAYLNAAHP